MMKKLILLPLLAGCLSEETLLIESWVGVYETDTYQLDPEGCGPEAPDAELPAPFLGVDALVWEEEAVMGLRQCEGPETCESAPWFDMVIDEIDEGRVAGTGGTYTFMPLNPEQAMCTVQGVSLVFTRDNEDQLDVEARSYVVLEALVSEEADCLAILEELPEDACAAFHLLESTRVR